MCMIKFATAFLILFIALSGCLDLSDGIKNTLIKESKNPAGNKKAILFLRLSGATVEDSYQVSVTRFNHSLERSEVGNAFTVDANHGGTTLDSASINLIWLSNDSLLIEFDKKLRTFTKKGTVYGVAILYHQM